MAYPLQNWDILISTTIHPSNLDRFCYSSESLRAFLLHSAAEKEKLRTRLMQDFYSRPERLEFEVRFNQGILIKLLNRLYTYRRQYTLDDTVTQLYEGISSHVGFILEFIEEYFDRYFDHSEKVPAAYLDISRNEIRLSFAVIEKIFSSRKDIDKKLITILIKNFRDFCEDTSGNFSYNDLVYQKELVKELLGLQQVPKDTDAGALLTELLLSINFNSPDFVQYLAADITASLAEVKQPVKKMEILLEKQKEYQLLRLPSLKGLYPGFASVKDIILLTLEKEMECSRDLQQKEQPFTGSGKQELVSVPFRGAEIYLLHKSFIDAGGAPNEIYKSLLEKTAPHLANKTQKGFSAESMVKYSDKVDPESKENVKRFLQKMIRNIDSYD